MANKQHEVNQRLYCCKLQLDHYEYLVAQKALPLAVVLSSAGEAALYHLQQAYRCYLQELAALHHLSLSSLSSADELREALAVRDIQTAEVAELIQLEHQPQSWLSLIQTQLPLPALTQNAPINSLSAEVQPHAAEIEPLKAAHHALTALIERQRSLSQEW